ncbi:hypothetical protein DVH05_021618 [Phytophthora capsici]|nr:hypothetical protein DVH05_021618 [Phytophthora capsici]
MDIILQNRSLEKRRRLDVPRKREHAEILSDTGSDRETSRTKGTFRPSSTQHRAHQAIASEKYKDFYSLHRFCGVSMILASVFEDCRSCTASSPTCGTASARGVIIELR